MELKAIVVPTFFGLARCEVLRQDYCSDEVRKTTGVRQQVRVREPISERRGIFTEFLDGAWEVALPGTERAVYVGRDVCREVEFEFRADALVECPACEGNGRDPETHFLAPCVSCDGAGLVGQFKAEG